MTKHSLSTRPQRPANAYTIWFTANRQNINQQHPGISHNEFQAKASEMWRDLDVESKKVSIKISWDEWKIGYAG